jgi:hypothetical protein
MAVPFVALSAVTSTGPGPSHDLGELADHHTMFFKVTGGASWTIVLEGSHDDTNWLGLGQGSGSSGALTEVTVPTTSLPGTLVRYVRANLTSLTGGSSPTVSATIASDTEQDE